MVLSLEGIGFDSYTALNRR